MAWSGYSEAGQGSLERGPKSFAVNVPGVVSKPDGVEFVGVKAGGNMRSDASISIPTAKVDNTLGELLKLGEKFIAPKIKEEQDRRFIEGMSRAASGVAMQEIIDEQPAYVTIFGEAPAVEGARAYTTAARKSAWVAEQQNNMAELAKIDTNDLGAIMHSTIKGQLTGDPITDAGITQELLGSMPDLIRTQTKARFLYLQKEAKESRRTAMAAAGAEYSAVWAADPATRTQDQMDKAENQLLNVWTPPPGVDVDSHLDDLTDMLAQQTSTGNFDALRLAYDTGITQQLGPDRENKLRVAALRAAPQALTKVLPSMINDLVELGRNPPASTEEYIARVNAINDRAAGESRVPREYGQLLSEEYMLRGVTAAAAAQDKKLVAHSKAAAAETHAAMLENIIETSVNNPDASGDLKFSTLAATLPGLAFKPAEIDAAVGKRLLMTTNPVEQATVLNRFGGDTITVGKDMARNLWESTSREGAKWETHGAGFEKMLDFYGALSEGAKTKYFPSADQRAQLDSWVMRKATLPNEPEARVRDFQALYETRQSVARADTSRLRDEPDAGTAEAAVQEVLQEQLTTGLWRSDSPLDVDQTVNTNVGGAEMQAARAVVQGLMRQQVGPSTQAVKAERALNAAIRTGLMSVHGGRLIFNENADEALKHPLSSVTGQNAESSALALEKVISQRISARKGNDDTRFVVRAPGLPIKYVVSFEDSEGKMITELVTADEVSVTLNEGAKPRSNGRGTRPANPVN